MYKLMAVLALAFFSFILWSIYLANTSGGGEVHTYVRSLPYGDKISHLVLFGTLSFLAIIGLKYRCFRIAGLPIYQGTALVSVFVVAEELSQGFIPIRTLDAYDLLADFIGISLATLAAKSMRHRFS